MAADTLGIFGGTKTKAQKLHRVGSDIIGFAGDYSDAIHFVRWWKDRSEKLEFRMYRGGEDAPDFVAMVANSNGIEKWTEHFQPTPILQEFFAIGSGAPCAMSAMHMGASAEEAVRISSLVDFYTGGEVVTMRASDAGT